MLWCFCLDNCISKCYNKRYLKRCQNSACFTIYEWQNPVITNEATLKTKYKYLAQHKFSYMSPVSIENALIQPHTTQTEWLDFNFVCIEFFFCRVLIVRFSWFYAIHVTDSEPILTRTQKKTLSLNMFHLICETLWFWKKKKYSLFTMSCFAFHLLTFIWFQLICEGFFSHFIFTFK